MARKGEIVSAEVWLFSLRGSLFLTLFVFEGCSVRAINDLEATSAAVSVVRTAFTQTWPFDFGTNANYAFNSSKIDFTGGVCRLSGTDQVDDDNAASGFGGGSFTGAAWDATNSYVRLSQSGTPTNVAELDASWTPKWSDLTWYWKMNGSGALAASVSSDVGSGACAKWAAASYATAKLNSGLQYTTSSGVDCTGTGIESISDKITVGGWFKQIDTTPVSGAQLVEETTGSAYGWSIQRATTTKNLRISVVTNLQTQTCGDATMPAIDGSWHHIMYSLNNGAMNVYMDGILRQTCAYSHGTGFASSTHPAFRSLNSVGTTTLDDWGVWHEQLSAADVAVIYSRQSAKYSGTFASRVMDAFQTGMSWTTLSWTPTLPFFKELPDAAMNETSTDYSSLVGSSGTVGDDNLMNGIVGLWHLGEAAGTTGAASVKDDSGQGNHGTPTSMVFGGAGKVGNAGTFNGTTSLINLGGTASLNLTQAFTFSAWVFPYSGTVAARGHILSKGTSGSSKYYFFSHEPSGKFRGAVWNSAGLQFGTVDSVPNVVGNTWQHVVYSYDGTTARLYVDAGTPSSTAYTASSPPTALGVPFQIGARTATASSIFNGVIDEVAIWNRALHPKEILQLYLRGANRVKHQVRVCTASDCSDDATGANWKGPDGTNQSYFSELNNNTVPLAMSGDVKKSLPSMLFSAFTSPIGTSRYFQYRTVLESDDSGTGCNYGSGATWCSPELKSVTVDPTHYNSGSPTVVGHTGVSFYSLATLTETLGASCAGGIGYNLGVGAAYSSAIWYWWDASANSGSGGWVVADGTGSNSNDVATITSHAPVFGTQVSTGTVYLKAFLKSSGTSTCELNEVGLAGER